MKRTALNGISMLLKDDNLRTLHGWKKVQHILAYYKFLLLIICIFAYFIIYNIYGYLTHKNIILYTALVNVVAGEDLIRQLEGDFLDHLNPDEQYQLICELLEPEFGSLYVTPPDIDLTVKRLSYTISEGIHMAFYPHFSTS